MNPIHTPSLSLTHRHTNAHTHTHTHTLNISHLHNLYGRKKEERDGAADIHLTFKQSRIWQASSRKKRMSIFCLSVCDSVAFLFRKNVVIVVVRLLKRCHFFFILFSFLFCLHTFFFFSFFSFVRQQVKWGRVCWIT